MTLSFRSTIVSILVRAVAYAAIATPASAHTYEYCLRDVKSLAQSCDFYTWPSVRPRPRAAEAIVTVSVSQRRERCPCLRAYSYPCAGRAGREQ